jgi:hypothetical protein
MYICKHRTAPPRLGEGLMRGILFEIAWFDDVHGSGENSRSCTFQQNVFFLYFFKACLFAEKNGYEFLPLKR